VVVGGGDSALDWTLILKDKAERLVLAHRRDEFRAHERSVEQLHEAGPPGRWRSAFHEVEEIRGNGKVEEVTLVDNRTERDGPWRRTRSSPSWASSRTWAPSRTGGWRSGRTGSWWTPHADEPPGVYAAGDIVDYEGKLDLIATGFAEAAIAVNNAVHHVDPKARVNPGHSTSMKVFKEK
jgi:ferredoxin/flavodoxin---NADP+ reductase